MITRRQLLGSSLIPFAAALVPAVAPISASAAQNSATPDPRRQWIRTLAGLVIPATTTPGADSPATVDFVMLVLDRRMSDLEPEMLPRVTRALDQASSGDFLRRTPQQQERILRDFDRACFSTTSVAPEVAHSWKRLKAAIAAGYYTSEAGATQELIYDPVPGAFRSIKVDKDTRITSNEGFNQGFGGAL